MVINRAPMSLRVYSKSLFKIPRDELSRYFLRDRPGALAKLLFSIFRERLDTPRF